MAVSRFAHLFVVLAVLLLSTRAFGANPRTIEGNALLERGEYEQAYALFSELYLEDPMDNEALFGLGRSCHGTKNYPLAIFAYENLLEREPSDRVRLELATVLMESGDVEKAKALFETVLAHNPPAAVQQNIRTALAFMSEQRTGSVVLHGGVAISCFQSSNVNAGVANREVNLNGTLISLNDNNTERADHGMTAVASVLAAYRPSNNSPWTLNNRGMVYEKWHRRFDRNDLVYVSYMPSVSYAAERWMAEVGGKVDGVRLDSRELMNIGGGNASFSFQVDRETLLRAVLSAEHKWYEQTPERSGNVLDAQLGVVRKVGDRVQVSCTLDWFREFVSVPKYANDGYAAAASASVALPWELTGGLTAGYRDVDYHAPATATMGDIGRDDHQYSAGASLSRKVMEQVSVTYQFNYVRNESNTNLYDYRIATHSIGVAYSF